MAIWILLSLTEWIVQSPWSYKVSRQHKTTTKFIRTWIFLTPSLSGVAWPSRKPWWTRGFRSKVGRWTLCPQRTQRSAIPSNFTIVSRDMKSAVGDSTLINRPVTRLFGVRVGAPLGPCTTWKCSPTLSAASAAVAAGWKAAEGPAVTSDQALPPVPATELHKRHRKQRRGSFRWKASCKGRMTLFQA